VASAPRHRDAPNNRRRKPGRRAHRARAMTAEGAPRPKYERLREARDQCRIWLRSAKTRSYATQSIRHKMHNRFEPRIGSILGNPLLPGPWLQQSLLVDRGSQFRAFGAPCHQQWLLLWIIFSAVVAPFDYIFAHYKGSALSSLRQWRYVGARRRQGCKRNRRNIFTMQHTRTAPGLGPHGKSGWRVATCCRPRAADLCEIGPAMAVAMTAMRRRCSTPNRGN
jgi:hypothetical protein